MTDFGGKFTQWNKRRTIWPLITTKLNKRPWIDVSSNTTIVLLATTLGRYFPVPFVNLPPTVDGSEEGVHLPHKLLVNLPGERLPANNSLQRPLVSPLPQLVVLRSHTVFVPVQSLFVRFAVTKSLPTSLFARHLSNVLYVRSFKISSVTSDFNQLL